MSDITTFNFRISNVKPISVNKAYYKTKKVLTLEGRRFRKRLLLSIAHSEEIKAGLAALSSQFDKEKHYLAFDVTFLIPKGLFYTKNNYISRMSGDLDNQLKLLTDFLCNEKNANRRFSGGKHPKIVNLGIDDQFIADYTARKRESHNPDYHLDISISLVPLEVLKMDSDFQSKNLDLLPSFDYATICDQYSTTK